MYAELLAQVPQQGLPALILAWHHHHLRHQSQGKQKRSHHFEQQQWLDFADGLLEHDLEPLQTLVFAQLDSIIRSSSLVEMVTGLIRPYLHSCKGPITQPLRNLIIFYHTHHHSHTDNTHTTPPFAPLPRQA